MKNIIYSPFGFYLSWIILCIIFDLLIPIITKQCDSSAQVPFILGTYTLVALICGTFLISLLNMLVFKTWIKKFWYINGFITFFTGILIVYFLIKIFTL